MSEETNIDSTNNTENKDMSVEIDGHKIHLTKETENNTTGTETSTPTSDNDESIEENSDFKWASDDFGEDSVNKIQQITDILSGLLTGLTVNVNDITTNGINMDDYYTKELSDDRYISKADSTTIIADLISQYMKNYLLQNKLVKETELEDVTKVINYLCKICFDQSYSDIEELDNMSVSPFPSDIANLKGLYSSIDTNMTKLLNAVFEHDSSGAYTGTVKFPSKDSYNNTDAKLNNLIQKVGTNSVKTGDTIVSAINNLIDNYNLLTGNSGSIGSLTVTVSNINNTVNDSEYGNRALNTRVSNLENRADDFDTSIANHTSRLNTASSDIKAISKIVYDDDKGNSNLYDLIDGLTTKISELEQRIYVLETKQ